MASQMCNDWVNLFDKKGKIIFEAFFGNFTEKRNKTFYVKYLISGPWQLSMQGSKARNSTYAI